MNNKKTIQKIQDWFDEQRQRQPIQRDVIPFNIQDVKIDGSTVQVEDCKFSEKATSKLLDVLSLKEDYESYRDKMEGDDYSVVTNKIKEAAGDRMLYGTLELTPDYTYEVSNLYLKNEKKTRLDDLCNAENAIKNICDALAVSNVEWDLKGKGFDYEKGCLYELHLQNISDPIEALKGDMWNQGHVFKFNSTEFKEIPYFERQVCTNGMMKETLGFASNIAKGSWHNEKLNKIVATALSENDTEVAALIQSYANKAIGTEISIAEFEKAMKLFDSEDSAHAAILDKYFNMAPFYKAYGDGIEKKSAFWKSTAKTGINAYGFVNMLTWIGSHSKDFKIDDAFATLLKVHAGSMFISKRYDMYEYAPNAKVEYPRFSIME